MLQLIFPQLQKEKAVKLINTCIHILLYNLQNSHIHHLI